MKHRKSFSAAFALYCLSLTISCSKDISVFNSVSEQMYPDNENVIATLRSVSVKPSTCYVGQKATAFISFNDDNESNLILRVAGSSPGIANAYQVVNFNQIDVTPTEAGNFVLNCRLDDGYYALDFDVNLTVNATNDSLNMVIVTSPLSAVNSSYGAGENFIIDVLDFSIDAIIDSLDLGTDIALESNLQYERFNDMGEIDPIGTRYKFYCPDSSMIGFVSLVATNHNETNTSKLCEFKRFFVNSDVIGKLYSHDNIDLSYAIVRLKSPHGFGINGTAVHSSTPRLRHTKWMYEFNNLTFGELYYCEAWLDRNEDGVIDSGDYYGYNSARAPVSVGSSPVVVLYRVNEEDIFE